MNKITTLMITLFFFCTYTNASETVTGAKKDIATFKQEMTVKLQSIELEIEKIKEKTKDKSTDAQNAAIKNIEETRNKIKADLDEIEKVSETNWKKFKNRVAKSVDKLNARTQALLKNE